MTPAVLQQSNFRPGIQKIAANEHINLPKAVIDQSQDEVRSNGSLRLHEIHHGERRADPHELAQHKKGLQERVSCQQVCAVEISVTGTNLASVDVRGLAEHRRQYKVEHRPQRREEAAATNARRVRVRVAMNISHITAYLDSQAASLEPSRHAYKSNNFSLVPKSWKLRSTQRLVVPGCVDWLRSQWANYRDVS
jgi:hypothetical protein